MFVISILLVLISSYFIVSSVCSKEEDNAGFLYLLLCAFSQIVLSFEILSLFSIISKNSFFILNLIFTAVSLILFKISKHGLYKFNFEIKKIKFAIKRDKILGFLTVCFILFLIFQLITAAFFPITFGDALSYYLTRCTHWIQQGNINHFITSDTRELIMPVNMEFLYIWKLLFTKNETGIAFFSYISFTGLVYIVYNLLKELNFSVRQRLWTIFVISSFALVAVEMYTPCADLFIGILILGGIYLYLKALKDDNKTAFYFSTLSFALAGGTKTTAIIAIPSVFFILCIITYLYKKGEVKKYLLKFCLIFLINFIIFASYNYILNIIQFMNPITSSEQMELNRFRGGFRGWLSNLIKYCFVIFDTSGIKDFINFNGFITYIQSLVLSLIGITDKTYTSNYFSRYFYFDEQMTIIRSFLGMSGLLIFLPSLIKSVKRLFKNKSKQSIILGTLSISLILNLLIFSRVMVFTGYNMRYILTFCVFAFPICVYSYIQRRKFFKYLLCFIMFIYLIGIAHYKPVAFIYSYIRHKINNPTKEYTLLANSDEIMVYKYLKAQNKKNIALITQHFKTANYFIEKLRLDGFNLENILLENIEAYDLSKYDYIITDKDYSFSSYIVSFEDRIKYPDLFVSECTYYDYKQNVIEALGSNPPAGIKCKVPYDYFKSKGFLPAEDFETKTYTILSNTVK